ncbi:hypothetical protein [Dyella tabacisoli]|uniref:hypothetical protein n=1 Tax=Dyella tabacisoli TaxID=2282381 RepID=UPI0013B3D752|nr:hypothetical protein [Dyella tabacisoli]
MRKDLKELATAVTDASSGSEVRLVRAVGKFAESLLRHSEQQEREIERIKGDIKRGARAGSGRFHL